MGRLLQAMRGDFDPEARYKISVIFAPWTDDQVASLNAYQQCDRVHPFTSERGLELIATSAGWVEEVGGPVVQSWAHDFMVDWRWRR